MAIVGFSAERSLYTSQWHYATVSSGGLRNSLLSLDSARPLDNCACPHPDGCHQGDYGCPPGYLTCCVDGGGTSCGLEDECCGAGHHRADGMPNCPPGLVCQNSQCVCPSGLGLKLCGGQCVDLNTDPMNCGTCQNQCPVLATCVNGKCICNDPKNSICNNRCVSLDSDTSNCGKCGVECPGSAASCISGTCLCGSVKCKPTQVCSKCEGIGCKGLSPFCCPQDQPVQCLPGYCTNIVTDPTNCGVCGNVCAGKCCFSVCCNPSESCCEGNCTDTLHDPDNCGQCGRACTGQEICVGGQCVKIPNLCQPGKRCPACNCPRGSPCVGGHCLVS
jgi:hypothetical protein